MDITIVVDWHWALGIAWNIPVFTRKAAMLILCDEPNSTYIRANRRDACIETADDLVRISLQQGRCLRH